MAAKKLPTNAYVLREGEISVGVRALASMVKIPVLAFAVGVYLPLSTMGAVFLGGLTRHLLTRNREEGAPCTVANRASRSGRVWWAVGASLGPSWESG